MPLRETEVVLVVTEDQARRHLLAKQHLTPADAASDVVAVADDLVGLHATGATAPYLQLRARLPGFRRDDLDRALYEDRSLARVRCMRTTVFIVSRALLPVVVAATQRFIEPVSSRFLATVGTTEADFRRLAPRIEKLLGAGEEALTAAELRRRLGVEHSLSGVVNLLCDQGRLLRDRPVGTWKSRTFTYRRFGDVLPDVQPAGIDEQEARRRLVERYVAAYGPVSEADVMWWSGIGLKHVRSAVTALSGDVAEVQVEGRTAAHVVHRRDLPALAGDTPPRDPPPVSLLPELDPYLMGFRDREVRLQPSTRDYLIDRAGNVAPTIVVDGLVAGVWDVTEEPQPALRFHLFGEPGPKVTARIRHEAASTGEFWFDGPVPVQEVATMVPLTRRTAGGFMTPLRGE